MIIYLLLKRSLELPIRTRSILTSTKCPVAARSVVDILDAEGVDKAIVVGHDWGSAIASRIATGYASRVIALVMVCAPYFKPGSFDVEAMNEMTEQAFGSACFGYWEVFLHEPELFTQHVSYILNAH